MTDARTGRRFPVKLPVRVGDSPVSAEHVGTTANISSSGAYFWLDSPVDVGSIIECEMTVPGKSIGSKKDVKIRCLARVIRADAPKKGQTGVACVIDAYEFVRPKSTKKSKSKPKPKLKAKAKPRAKKHA